MASNTFTHIADRRIYKNELVCFKMDWKSAFVSGVRFNCKSASKNDLIPGMWEANDFTLSTLSLHLLWDNECNEHPMWLCSIFHHIGLLLKILYNFWTTPKNFKAWVQLSAAWEPHYLRLWQTHGENSAKEFSGRICKWVFYTLL